MGVAGKNLTLSKRRREQHPFVPQQKQLALDSAAKAAQAEELAEG